MFCILKDKYENCTFEYKQLNKVGGVRELLIKYKFDILALSETWLTTDISDDETNIPG